MLRVIISDSACDMIPVTPAENVRFIKVPLTLTIEGKNYPDDEDLNVELMVQHMEMYKGKSGSACPGPNEWLEAAKGADEVFFVTIASGLSGSFASASVAREMLGTEQPKVKIGIIDSRSASGQNGMVVQKLAELAGTALTFEEIMTAAEEYRNHLKTNFVLFSVDNLVKNGRVSRLAGKALQVLKMTVLGENTPEATIHMVTTCRSFSKGLKALLEEMKKNGYNGGRVVASHCFNEFGIARFEKMLRAEYPDADLTIMTTGGLTSFYAERSGIIVGYEID